MSKKSSKNAATVPDNSTPEELMNKILKTEEDCVFMGKPARLFPLSWRDGMIISALLSDIRNCGKAEGVSAESLTAASKVLEIAATIRFSLKQERPVSEGSLRKEYVHVYKSMEEVNKAVNNDKIFDEFVRLYNLYNVAFELTAEQKKS